MRPAARDRPARARRQHPRRRLAIGRPAREHDPPIRRRATARSSPVRRTPLGPPPERIAGAHVDDDDARSAGTPSAAQPLSMPRARRIDRHLHAIDRRIRRAGKRRVDRGSRSHWFSTECRARSSRGRCTTRVYIQRGPHIVAHSHGRPRGPGEPRAARSAVQVNRRRRMRVARSRRASASRRPRAASRASAAPR